MRRGTRAIPLATLVVAVLALPAVAAPAARSPSPMGGALSNETTLSRWAHTATRSRVRARPNVRARAIARLRDDTEDGRPELYLALRSLRDRDGRTWVEVRLPRRPNGSTGWVRRSALGTFHRVSTALEIDTRRLRATLRRGGRVIWSAPVGIGARGSPTPHGHFYVRELLRNLDGDPLYGPWAFGTSAYARASDWPGGGVVGIHGTDAPALIPGRPSHGCIRLTNEAVARLARLLPLGTPIRIT